MSLSVHTIVARPLVVVAMLGHLPAAAQAPLTGVRAREQTRSIQDRTVQRPVGIDGNPWSLRTALTLEAEANDNINVSETDRQSDVILRPQMSVQLGYVFTPVNSLRLDTSVGYAKYLSHSENDHIFINTDSITGLSVDLLVRETRVNLHSSFSLKQNPLDEGEVSGRSDYRQFQNATGFQIEPTHERLRLVIGYDHIIELYNSAFRAQDRSMENGSLEVGYKVSESTIYGVWMNGGYFNPHSDARSEAITFGAGLDVKLRLSEYLQFSAEAGYGYAEFLSQESAADAQRQSSFVGALSVRHRVNRWFIHHLRAGTDVVPSLNSNFRQIYHANHSTDWSVIRNVRLTTDLFYEHSTSSLDTGGEDYDRLGSGVGIAISLGKGVEVRTDYRFTWKGSNLPGSDYDQNRLSVSVTKRF